MANLQGVTLQGANLRGTELQWADLQGADLTGVTFDEHTNLRDCNLAGANVSNITWPTGLLTTAKKSTWSVLSKQIIAANPKDLLSIYNANKNKGHIFDLREYSIFDKIYSFFFSSIESIELTTHRKLFNEAICKRISELLQSSDTTQEDKKALQQLQQTINPDSAAPAATHSLRI